MHLVIPEDARGLLSLDPALLLHLRQALTDLKHLEQLQVFHRLVVFGVFIDV